MDVWLIPIAWYAAIGLVAGYLASRLMKQRGNPVYYMLLGVAGALIGGILWTILGSILSFMFNLLVATIGAVILILLWRGWQSKKRFR